MTPSLRLALTVCASALASAPALAQTPSFNLVGIAPGATASRVYGVSADGSIAAGRSSGSVNFGPGFTWAAAGGRSDFGLESGLPPVTQAFAISGDGTTVAGQSFTQIAGSSRAFRWSGSGTYQDLGSLPGGYNVWSAQGVNGDGSVVVGYGQAGQNLIGQAFRWTASTGMQGLGYTRPTHSYSEAAAISRDGSTIVGRSRTASGDGDAFVWTQASGMQMLPQLPGTPFLASRAKAVNADGSVIVGVSGATQVATMWRGGQVIDLGTAWGFVQSNANAVDDLGAVVAGNSVVSGVQRAAVWTESGGMVPLADYLNACGATVPSGWTLQDCFAVSGDGRTFGGWARSGAGQGQGFVATVPGPGTLLLTSLGLLAAGQRSRA